MNKRALLLLLGLVSIYAGAWVSYVVSDGCGKLMYLVAQTAAGTVVLLGILLIVLAFRRKRNLQILN